MTTATINPPTHENPRAADTTASAESTNQLCPSCKRNHILPGHHVCPECGRGKPGKIKEHYWHNVANNLCTTCDTDALLPSHRQCPDCLRKNAARQAKIIKKRIAKGLCRSCGQNQKAPNLTRCLPCNQRNLDVTESRHAARLTQGLCENCGLHPFQDELRQCSVCIAKNANRPRSTPHTEPGKCAQCKHADADTHLGFISCTTCRNNSRRLALETRTARLAQGLCVKCGMEPKRPNANTGESCALTVQRKRSESTQLAQQSRTCTRCRSEDAEPGYARCSQCRKKASQWARENNKKRNSTPVAD